MGKSFIVRLSCNFTISLGLCFKVWVNNSDSTDGWLTAVLLVKLTINNTFKITIFSDCVNPFLFLFPQFSLFACPSFNDKLHRQSEAVYMSQPIQAQTWKNYYSQPRSRVNDIFEIGTEF